MNDPAILIKNRDELKQDILDKYGYLYCQNCGKNKCGMKLEWHHIIFRSEAPEHPMLHDKKNLILLGSWCHKEAPDSYHKQKSKRDKLVLMRGLDLIFNIHVQRNVFD